MYARLLICLALISMPALHCQNESTVRTTKLVSPDQLPAQPELPDPLMFSNGKPVESPNDWLRRVQEIETLFAHYMYGYMPPAGAIQHEVTLVDPNYMEGQAIKKLVTLTFGPEGTPPLHLLVVIPAETPDPAPVFLGLNFYGNHSVLPDEDIPLSAAWMPERGEGVVDNRATDAARGTSMSRWSIAHVVSRGYAVATFYHGDIDPDRDDFSDGVHASIPLDGSTERTDHSWGALSAWAWGLHRVVDYLVLDPDIDADRIAVMGHSRNGKAALWAAATDPRVALVISNQSGCGGAALSRRRMGETVEAINTRFPHWFSRSFHAFNDDEDRLPFDQHMLIAMMAPRPVLVASAEEDNWADPEGEFLALKGAEPVYNLLGFSGLNNEERPGLNELVGAELGYHIRPGGHGVGAMDWDVFIRFADRHFEQRRAD